MTSNIHPIVSNLDAICELLQAAIDLMQDPVSRFTAESHSQALSRVRAFSTGEIGPTNTDEICRMTLMMAYVEELANIERWPNDLVSQTLAYVKMHDVMDEPDKSIIEQALHRLKVTHDDCREMLQLKSPN